MRKRIAKTKEAKPEQPVIGPVFAALSKCGQDFKLTDMVQMICGRVQVVYMPIKASESLTITPQQVVEICVMSESIRDVLMGPSKDGFLHAINRAQENWVQMMAVSEKAKKFYHSINLLTDHISSSALDAPQELQEQEVEAEEEENPAF